MSKKAVKIFLINKKNEVLLELRDNKKGIYFPGYWGLIGGGVNEGETLLDAMKREIKEEINLKAENIKELGTVKSSSRSKSIDVTLFRGNLNIPAEKIKLNEVQKVKFFRLEDICSLKIPQFLRRFISNNKILD